jgi:hypothetical protein
MNYSTTPATVSRCASWRISVLLQRKEASQMFRNQGKCRLSVGVFRFNNSASIPLITVDRLIVSHYHKSLPIANSTTFYISKESGSSCVCSRLRRCQQVATLHIHLTLKVYI